MSCECPHCGEDLCLFGAREVLVTCVGCAATVAKFKLPVKLKDILEEVSRFADRLAATSLFSQFGQEAQEGAPDEQESQ